MMMLGSRLAMMLGYGLAMTAAARPMRRAARAGDLAATSGRTGAQRRHSAAGAS
jgi:hypothetical protein